MNENETLNLAIELNTEHANFYACQALPGSPLYQQAKNNNWYIPEKYEEFAFLSYEAVPLPTKYLTSSEVLKFRDDAWHKYFSNKDFLNLVEKKFGTEKGLFHKGTSGTNTISLNENIKVISLKDKIRDVIFNSSGEVHLQDIIKKLQKTNEDIPVDIHLNDLVDEMKIFRISPGTFLNFEDGIKLCDKDDVKSVLNEVLDNYEFITTGFIREFVNDRLGFNLSNFYYDTLARLLAKENNWYYGANYLSKNRKKTIGGKKYIIENYDENLSTTENFKILSKKIGISKMYYNNIVYQYKNNFNTDWIHKDD